MSDELYFDKKKILRQTLINNNNEIYIILLAVAFSNQLVNE